jgi:ABC-type phosphonate transport system ATPase subunit
MLLKHLAAFDNPPGGGDVDISVPLVVLIKQFVQEFYLYSVVNLSLDGRQMIEIFYFLLGSGF